jgi:CheY-like chemotaxis protein
MSIELHPPIFQHGSLIEALHWIAAEEKKKYNLTVNLDLPDELDLPRDEIGFVVFDCVRELLFNVVKHSGVGVARLKLSRSGNALIFCVSDEGKGCDPDLFESHGAQVAGHFGLFSLKERIEDYEGRFEITTAPGRGFQVRVTLPYSGEPPAPGTSAWPGASDSDAGDEPAAEAAGVNAIRVLVVDDHQLFREGIVNILHSEGNVRIVGEAANGQEAVELACALHPDLILMDINLPIMNGIQATRVIAGHLPDARIVALSMNRDGSTIRSILEAGARAYVQKASCTEDLIRTINQVMADHPSER